MPRSRYRFGEESYPHFMTNTVVAWLPVFSQPDFANVILQSWRFLQQQRDIRIFAFVIMENHLHFIASASQHSERIQQFKSITTRQVLDLLEQCKAITLLNYFAYYKRKHKTES